METSKPLSEPKPKRKRRGPTVPPLDIEDLEEPKYKATDDDLPLVFWPEPDFDKETEQPHV